MPSIVGSAQTVVEHEGLRIDELAGNVATKDDRISIAHVTVSKPASEPWLTLHYDEWMCVLKGVMVLLTEDTKGEPKSMEVKAGQTVFIAKGERFRPTFPEGNTEYVPVCLPAFRPDRCIREDDGDTSVAANLSKLHSRPAAPAGTDDEPHPETLYHMCQLSMWEDAKSKGTAYFPPTFEADGFTHATAVPARLITTANHFYQDVEGEWVCLRFARSALRRHGIIVRDEEAMPVGDKSVGMDWANWICPHVVGGIPPAVVDAVLPMTRNGKEYVSITGLAQ
jgi:mannose-6-phosphate isomerase-like protein (cupin superfamily)